MRSTTARKGDKTCRVNVAVLWAVSDAIGKRGTAILSHTSKPNITSYRCVRVELYINRFACAPNYWCRGGASLSTCISARQISLERGLSMRRQTDRRIDIQTSSHT